MMNFDSDIIVLLKENGERYENIKADVQTKIIFINDASLPIEEGDKLLRTLPNGLVESYSVIDRGYYNSMGGFGAHYQVKVSKEKGTLTKSNVTNNYHADGNNARINIDSNDNSKNNVKYQNDNEKTFKELREVILSNIENNTDILKSIEEMELNQNQPSFKDSFNNFISRSADYMTIILPFIPLLTNMIVK
ncbi:hypothetical protein [Clostridium tagluense]|uniref:hypothetical protein n=1 Tax=Clostridium tagluense TaxID=360422 RepID=UPI001C0BB0E0|nr:hypothetical protein [Clostridium tagluense]MBU3128738.1 hypothetical protein [Clostridium tagluense]